MADVRARQAETDPVAALLRRLTDLEREVRELRAARRLRASAVDASDGSLQVIDGGVELLRIGDLGNGYHGVQIRRETGELAMTSWSPGSDDPGFVAPLWDLSGNYVVTDDGVSRRGLARPYLTIPMADITEPTATVTSSTFAAVASGISGLENPGLIALVIYESSASGTTGQIQMSVDGNLIGSPVTVNSNDFVVTYMGPMAHGVTDYAGVHRLDLMARRTAGTGTIGARVLGAMGLESSWL